MNTTVERQRRKGVMLVVGWGLTGRVAVRLYKYTTTLIHTNTHSHAFFNSTREWGVGNDREEKRRERELGPRFLITPLAYLQDIPIR